MSSNSSEKGSEIEILQNLNNQQDLEILSKEHINKNDVLTTVKSVDGHEVKVTANVDEAMYYADESETVELTDEKDRRLLWKIDLYVLPLICLVYALQFMDKVSSSYAAIMGLRTYYNMKGDMYSWCGSAFYLSYLIFEFPISMLLQKFPVVKVTSIFIILWGLIIAIHGTPSNYAGFITLRVLLGAFESAVTPAMVIITGQWYRAEEQFLRTAIWFSSNGLGTIMGSAIAYGLAIRPSSYSIEPWKVLFIVIGIMTIFVGFLLFAHLPDLPTKAWFLNDEEKKLIVLRIKKNQQGFGSRHFKFSQFKEALLDINTWLFFFCSIAAQVPNGGLTNFGAILLSETFKYSPTESLLMNMIAGAVEIIGCISLAYSAKYIKHRFAVSLFTMTIVLTGSCMLAFADQSPHARLAGYYINFLGAVIMICNLSCYSSNVAGFTKKITGNALFLIGYCVGNLIGPQTFIASQAPRYRGGQIAMVVCNAVELILIAAIYYSYWTENKKRDKLQAEGKLEIPNIHNIEFADLTDKENTLFRYRL